MNPQNPISTPISLADIEAVVQQARHARAEAMRAALGQVPVLFKRLAGRLRPNRGQLPQCGAWA